MIKLRAKIGAVKICETNSPLGQAMQDCGLENFTIEVIEECETPEQANDRERFWIRVLKSKMPNGYNRSNGSEGGTHKQKSTSLGKGSGIFNGRLKNLRNSKKISQKEFAQVLGVSQQTVASWESGRTEPSNATLKDIADYFNVSADYLIGRETPTSPILSLEQTAVLDGFDSLNESGRNALMAVLSGLLSVFPARAAM